MSIERPIAHIGKPPTDSACIAISSFAITTEERMPSLVSGLRYRRAVFPMHIVALNQWRTLVLCPALVVMACASDVPNDSGCRNLVYKEEGLSRSEYLPCAGEIVAALDELERQSEAASRGDRKARADGRATLTRVNALMKSAGGRNLLERWDDRALTNLNLSISNAVARYEAFYMIRVMEEPAQFAAQTRQAAEAELRAAIQRNQQVRGHYQRVR